MLKDVLSMLRRVLKNKQANWPAIAARRPLSEAGRPLAEYVGSSSDPLGEHVGS